MPEIDSHNITNVVVAGKSGAGKQPRIDVIVKEFGLEQLSTGNIFRSYLGKFNSYGYEGDLKEFWDGEKQRFVSDGTAADKLGTDDEDVILGMKAKYFVDRGLFVPDYITNEILKSYFSKKGYRNQVLDGYPRTLNQAEFLLRLVDEANSVIDFVLLVENSDENILERTVNRRICPVCGEVYHLKYKPPEGGRCRKCRTEVIQRSDDTEEKIRSRLEEFRKKTMPALRYLEDRGMPIIRVPGHLEEFTPENVHKSVMDAIEHTNYL
jgi:adenylate kinase